VPRGVKHSDELRTAVVRAVRAGESISEAAKRFEIDRTLAWRWTRGKGSCNHDRRDESTRVSG
jgi:transposase-like protein